MIKESLEREVGTKETDIEQVELNPEVQEAIETITERTGNLILKEMDIAEEVSREKPHIRGRNSMLFKAGRTLALISVLMGVGGAVNQAEAGSWRAGKRQTAGAISDVIIGVGGAIIADRIENSREKEREKIKELENNLAQKKESLKAEEEQLEILEAQTGGDVSHFIKRTKEKIDALREQIEKDEKILAELTSYGLGDAMRDSAERAAKEAQRRRCLYKPKYD